MAYKFRRYKIKWSLKRRKFRRKKIDRKRSRKAHMTFMRHRSTMLAALRRNRQKIRRKAAKNKNAGMWIKLKKARKRFKHLLKNSVEYGMPNILYEEIDFQPEVELDEDDLEEMLGALDEIRDTIEHEDDDEEDRKSYEEYIDNAKAIIQHILDHGDVPETEEDEEMVSDVLRFIDVFYTIQDEDEDEE